MNASVIFINSNLTTKEIVTADFEIIKKTFQKIGAITCIPKVIRAGKNDITRALNDAVSKSSDENNNGFGFIYKDTVIITCPCDPAELVNMIKSSIGPYLLQITRPDVMIDYAKEDSKKISEHHSDEGCSKPKYRKKSLPLRRVDIFLRVLLVIVICSSAFFTYNIAKVWRDNVTSKGDYAKIAADAHSIEKTKLTDINNFNPMHFDFASLKSKIKI